MGGCGLAACLGSQTFVLSRGGGGGEEAEEEEVEEVEKEESSGELGGWLPRPRAGPVPARRAIRLLRRG